MDSSLINQTLKLFFADSTTDFENKLQEFLTDMQINEFTIWSISGNICDISSSTVINYKSTFDIFELGYDVNNVYTEKAANIDFFNDKFFISSTLFLRHNNYNLFAITFHTDLSNEIKEKLLTLSPFISKRAYELYFKDRQMNLYVDYQKKVDFIKKGSMVFKALDIEEVIALSLTFFMDVFSADAVFSIFKDKFHGIGLDEIDIISDITVTEMMLDDYLKSVNETVFLESGISSSKFNIKNTFIVYEPIMQLRFVLFNISVDIVPDKEFSELVTGIISIAVENSLNHQKMMKFKLEETEMQHTVDILNRFVQKTISFPDNRPEIYAVNYPARAAGGDFVDVIKLNDKILFAVADVCGKGYSAAVFTVVLSVFSSIAPELSLTDAVHHINDFLLSKNFSDRFITGFFGILDTKSNELEFISCGHDPAFLISNESETVLSSEYLPLGILNEDYISSKVKIAEGSILFVYTDGLIEYTTYECLVTLIKKLGSLKTADMVDTLYKKLVTEPELQRDDFTCIAMKF